MQRLNRRTRQANPDTTEDSGSPAVVEDSPTMNDLPALDQGFLATVGGYVKHEAIKYQEDSEGTPFKFLRFFSGKSNNAVDVKIALGKGIQEGHPYVSSKGEILDAATARFAILAELPHWVTTGADYAPDRCWLTPQPWGKTVGEGEKIKESMAAVVLLFPREGEAYTALAEVRTTKVPFVKDYLKSVEASVNPKSDEDKALVKRLGKLMGLPPRFRQLGTLKIVPKTGSGFAYGLAKAEVSPITLSEIEALQAWGADAEAQAERESIEKLFARKQEEIEALAAKTTD